jgi:hypothetical protein
MKEKLKDSLKSAMKDKDKVRLETIRSIMTEIQYEEMQKGVNEISPAETMAVLQRELKKRQEAIQFAEQANRAEAKEKLLSEIKIIEGFLPSQLGAEQLEKIIGDLKQRETGITLNVVMKHLKDNYAGQYDGKMASEIAKRVVG